MMTSHRALPGGENRPAGYLANAQPVLLVFLSHVFNAGYLKAAVAWLKISFEI